MRGETLVICGDGSRVLWRLCGCSRETGHDLAVPEHVVGHEQSARPEQSDEAIEQRLVQLLAAVLEDQIEWARHLRNLQLRVADDDARAIGDAQLKIAKVSIPYPLDRKSVV